MVTTFLESQSASAATDSSDDEIGKGAIDCLPGVVVGVVIAFRDDGTTPLVVYRGQKNPAAIPARATLDLHSEHIGRPVLLVFENSDPSLPIVTGVLRRTGSQVQRDGHEAVEVMADGERLILDAQKQLVLRCGKASITLTREGKVLIAGSYILSRSTGVNRIKGGSVQLN
jgi:hypothetical protein